VARRNRQHPQRREMQVTFEPSRLSPSWVAQAYEQIVPIVRRTTSRSLRPGQAKREPSSLPVAQWTAASQE
jgi:hypothetical protein